MLSVDLRDRGKIVNEIISMMSFEVIYIIYDWFSATPGEMYSGETPERYGKTNFYRAASENHGGIHFN